MSFLFHVSDSTIGGIDEYTKLMLHMDGADEGVTFTDDSLSGHTVTPTASKTFTWTRPDGSDIGEGFTKSVSSGGSSVVINNNKVRCFAKSDGVSSAVSSSMYSSFSLSGDFDIQTDFNGVDLPIPSVGGNYFYLSVGFGTTAGGSNYKYCTYYRDTNGKRYYRGESIVDGVGEASSGILTTNTSGIHRMTRIGTTVTTYFWNGSGWTQTEQRAGFPLLDTIIIRLQAYIYLQSIFDITVDVDNFIINSGTVVDYPSPYTAITEKKFGSAAGYFGGDVSYLTVPDSDDWDFGSGDFTVDFWIKPGTTNSNTYPVGHWQGNGNANFQFRFADNNKIEAYAGEGPSSWDISLFDSQSLTSNEWHHIAFIRNLDNWSLYVDGTLVDSTTSNPTLTPKSALLEIGGTDGGQYNFNGYIDELRISKGIASLCYLFIM